MAALRFVVWSLYVMIVAVVAMVTPSPASAQSLKIKVRGSAKIIAHASRDRVGTSTDGLVDLVLAGSLADDAGQPLAGETVSVRVTRESDPNDAKVSEGLRAARSCDRATDRPQAAYAVRAGAPNEVLVVTDEAGRFCFRARLPPIDRHQAHLAWRHAAAPNQAAQHALVDAADADIAFDLSRQTLLLRFDPTPRIVALDNPRMSFEAAALVEDEGTTHAQSRLELVLVNEKNEELGRTETDGSGRARFLTEASKVGPPGRGELRVSFKGDRDTAFATVTAEIERRVKVSLRVPALEKSEQKPLVPEDGIPIVVEVGSSVGPVSEGGVEARIGETVVGAAPVERGIARLTMTFTAPPTDSPASARSAAGAEAVVRLRYVPSAPWFEPLGDTTVRVPIRGPSLWSKLPILLAGLAVLAFFLVGRVASRATKPEPAKPPAGDGPRPDAGKPRLDVVKPAARGETGWRGDIADAHEDRPVANARVWIERGTFDGRQILASTSTDVRGRFELPHVASLVGDEQFACEAPLHARLVQALPPPGQLSIALVLRRRALLARLVTWARRRGRPFDVKPEPTPGHVRRAAAGDPTTVRWAEAVERAVYGGVDVDARTEGEIDRLAPSPGPGTPGAGAGSEAQSGARDDDPVR